MRKTRKISSSNPTYAVVGDGECEAWYVNMLKRNERSIRVSIKPELQQKKSLSQQYEMVCDLSKSYDKVFWIIDLDAILLETRQHTNPVNKTALQQFEAYKKEFKPEQSKVKIIVNNPCLEFWFLLHFESTNKYFDNCDKAGTQLKKYLADYKKSQKYFTQNNNDIYLKLKPNLGNAITNAERYDQTGLDLSSTSISQMYLLFQELGIS
ncbi:RloB family protein [Emticicia sp. 21SJ11W-3]|uniref:RloB family protein n=1 Tax=Emticicia sp. 21SJ11W-3 TaxID=2916755 RepID=UPI0020A0F6E6|nr:RloB family protein [Emticicia sp. 21SJ11W-3]UTA66706.1 RloB family protein [Emticicia sp. 21SJ11W-3]